MIYQYVPYDPKRDICLLRSEGEETMDTLDKALTLLGSDDWELVTIVKTRTGGLGRRWTHRLILKRESQINPEIR